jgi:type IV secretion system protein VirB9
MTRCTLLGQGAVALALLLTACRGKEATAPSTYVRAQPQHDPAPPAPVVVTVPEPAPTIAGQLKPLPLVRAPLPAAPKRAPAPPMQVVAETNRRAAQSPASQADTFNAIFTYVYEPGSLYQVYAAPMFVTDLALQPGEHIVGQPACGDTVRWVIAEGKSLQGGAEQWHLYLKPTRPGLETNLAINTDHHAYMLELHSFEDTYMAVVSWRYPQEEVAKLQAEGETAAAAQNDAAPVASLSSLNFHYAIQVTQGKPVWTPVQVFDDGRKTFVRFPESMLVRESPALFVLSAGNEPQLVNYRMKNDFYVIDRLIESAELRVGGADGQEIVRIFRSDHR